MLNSDFLERDLGIVSSSHFAYDVSRKKFLILLTDQISLPDCLLSRDIGPYVYCNCLLARL